MQKADVNMDLGKDFSDWQGLGARDTVEYEIGQKMCGQIQIMVNQWSIWQVASAWYVWHN